MRPSARSLVCGEQWSGAASRRFTSLVRGSPLLVKVFSVVHSVLHVDVYHYVDSWDTVNIRDVLISEGHAALAEEPYESKVPPCACWGGWCGVRVRGSGCSPLAPREG